MSAPAQSTKAPGHKTELQRIQSIEEVRKALHATQRTVHSKAQMNAAFTVIMLLLMPLQQSVITCIDLAATATEQLSSIGNVDKAAVVSACEAYVENIKVSRGSAGAVATCA